MSRKKMEGQWQENSYPDVGCKYSRGKKCVECPYDLCLDEYPVDRRLAISKGLYSDSDLILPRLFL